MKRILIIGALAFVLLILFTLMTVEAVTSKPLPQEEVTSQFQTLRAILDPRLTETANVIASQAVATVPQTADSSSTGETSATLTANFSGLAPEEILATQQLQTVWAIVGPRLTLTANDSQIRTGTAGALATANGAINLTLGVTATPAASATLTPSPSATFSGTDQQQTISAFIALSLTQTQQARTGGTATAFFQQTVDALVKAQLAATTMAIRPTLIAGLQPITVSNARSVKVLASLSGHTDSIRGVVFSPNGATFASASLDRTVRIWDTLTGKQLFKLDGLSDRQAVVYSPDGSFLVSCSSDTTVRLWEAQSGTELPVLKGHSGGVGTLAFNADGTLLASAGDDGAILLWRGKQFSSAGQLRSQPGQITGIAFSPDGKRLASINTKGQLILWEMSAQVALATLSYQQGLSTLAFSPDGSVLVVAGMDGLIQLWNPDKPAYVGQIRGQGGWIDSIAFSPDGKILASASRDGTIWLWDIQKQVHLATLQRHQGAVTSLAFSSDGTRLISGGFDRMINIWGVKAGDAAAK